MKGKLKCVVALLLCMTMAFGTNLSTLADTNTAVPQTVQVHETEQTVQEGEAAQTTGEQQQTQETKETSSGETQTQQETQAEETKGGQTAQAEEKQNVQEEEQTEQEAAQTPESQGETTVQTGKKESAEVKEETAEIEVVTEIEPTTEAEKEDINDLSAEEIYAYLSKIETDASYFETWGMLNQEKKKEVNAYIDEITKGEIITVNNDNGAVNFALAAPLLSSEGKKAAKIKLKNIMADNQNFAIENTEPYDGVEISKSIKDYDPETREGHLTLEAFVTGEKTTITKSKPIDVVLVLDQSGSMTEDFGYITDYQKQDWENSTAYGRFEEGTVIYTPDESGEYCEVKITQNSIGSEERYEKVKDWWGKNPEYGDLLDQTYYYKDGDQYYALTIETEQRTRPISGFQYTVYRISYEKNGQTIVLTGGDDGFDTNQRTSFEVYKKVQEVKYEYTYEWTTSGGQSKSITSVGAREYPGIELYIKISKNANRLEALKDSVNKFVDSVEKDAAQNNVEHRIAIAGFSSAGYYNTEILTLSGNQAIHNKNGVAYQPNNWNYNQAAGNALQSTLTDTGKESIANAIDALTADGGTETGDGVAMASDIFEKQSQQYQDEYTSGDRKKVTIIFTDGDPTGDNTGLDPDDIPWDWGTVTESFNNVEQLKTSNTTVYTVGIFKNANGTVNASDDGEGNKTPDPAANWSNGENANKFMHLLSSNFLNVYSSNPMNTPENYIRKDLEAIKDENGNIQRYKSYYLSASDSDGLNEVFDQISDEIGGGATQKLDETTVMFDELSDYFTLPENVDKDDIVVEVDKCTAVTTGANGEKEYEFANDPTSYEDAQVVIEGKKISITNFNYAQNWVGMNNGKLQGEKLIVTIPIKLDTKTTFGGNNLPTNKGTAGIYNQGGTECYGNFEIPVVNVSINYQINAKDQVIHITNPADLEKILEYADGYKPNGINNKFVDITYTLKQGGVAIGTYQISHEQAGGTWSWTPNNSSRPILKECTDYSLECTVQASAPATQTKWGEEAVKQTYAKPAAVHVLTPEITVNDKCVFLGEKINVNNQINSEKTVEWEDQNHKDIAKEDAIDTEPEIILEATLTEGTASSDLAQYQPETDSNLDVKATVGTDKTLEKGKYYEIVNKKEIDCEENDCYKPIENPEQHDFTIHVVAGEIEITKVAQTPDWNVDGESTFTFKIEDQNGKTWYRSVTMDKDTRDNTATTELLSGLPKGVYTITELDTIKYDERTVEKVTDRTCPVSAEGGLATVYIGYTASNDSETKLDARHGHVKFTNKRTDSGKKTDSDTRLNRFTKNDDGSWNCEKILVPQNPSTIEKNK